MMRKRIAILAATLLAAAGALQATVASGTSGPNARAALKSVNVDDNFFSPARLSARRGELVRFVWTGDARHNVRGFAGQRFNSGFSGKTSGSFRIRVRARRGTRIRFLCDFHAAEMRGRILVR